MRLVNAYADDTACKVLFDLLAERSDEPDINISHRSMPTWAQHCRFFYSSPYPTWCLIRVGDDTVGAVYLSRDNEIGVFVFNRFRGHGYGKAAVKELMRQHPRPRYLANINPRNERSAALFAGMGFALLQHTYELRS